MAKKGLSVALALLVGIMAIILFKEGFTAYDKVNYYFTWTFSTLLTVSIACGCLYVSWKSAE